MEKPSFSIGQGRVIRICGEFSQVHSGLSASLRHQGRPSAGLPVELVRKSPLDSIGLPDVEHGRYAESIGQARPWLPNNLVCDAGPVKTPQTTG